MKAMKKMMMSAALIAGLMIATTGQGSAQRMNQSALALADRLTILSVSPVSGRLSMNGISSSATNGGLGLTNQESSGALQLDVNGTLDDAPFSGLWTIDRFEKRGRRLYAVGRLVNIDFLDVSGLTEGQSFSGSSTVPGSLSFSDTLGSSYFGSSYYGYAYGSTPLDPYYSRSDTEGIYFGSSTMGDIGYDPLSDRFTSDLYLTDTAGMIYGSTGSPMLGYTTLDDATLQVVNVSVSDVAVPVTISGATCESLHLRLAADKPTMGNAYRGIVNADAGMAGVAGDMITISSDDLASDESGETFCTISSIVNGNGSTNALVEQLNTLIASAR